MIRARKRFVQGGQWLVPLLLLLACADDRDQAPGLCDGRACPASCRSIAFESCDVRKTKCLQQILDAVICVRGTPGVLPEVRTLTESEYREELEAESEPKDAGTRLDGDEDAGVDDAGTPSQALDAKPDHWSVGLQLLGLLAPDTDSQTASTKSSVTSVAGFYSSIDRRITLIDRGVPLDDPDIQRNMAHELVHALQDQDLGLYELRTRGSWSDDGQFASGCLVEGEANLYEELAWQLLNRRTLDVSGLKESIVRNLKYYRRGVVSDASPYYEIWSLRYPVGTSYLIDAWRHGGNWEVQSLHEAPPNASIQWMVGYEANQTRREHLVLPLACPLAAVPKDYELYSRDSLGPFVLFAFLGHTLLDGGVYASEEHWRNAQHWRQDSFTLFSGPNGETAVSYRIRFDDEDLAVRLASALRNVTGRSLTVHRSGAEIEILAAEDSSVLVDWKTDPKHCE